MAIAIGAFLALSIGISASYVGFDRDRALYPVVMIVIAFYYALFAVMGGSVEALALESVAIVIFVAASVAGFRYSLWLVAAALVAHGAYDIWHNEIFLNKGVPTWWPRFCLAYDVVAGLYLAWMLKTGRLRSRDSNKPTTQGLVEANR